MDPIYLYVFVGLFWFAISTCILAAICDAADEIVVTYIVVYWVIYILGNWGFSRFFGLGSIPISIGIITFIFFFGALFTSSSGGPIVALIICSISIVIISIPIGFYMFQPSIERARVERVKEAKLEIKREKQIAWENSIDGKIANVVNMRKKLEDQLLKISNTQNDYKNQIKNLVAEIQDEKIKYKISSLSQATDRIKYDLLLIQETDAYLTKLVEIKRKTQTGVEETIYMERKLLSRQKMDSIVSNGKSLSKDIDKLLDKYNPYTETFAIDRKKLQIKSIDEIWSQIK